MTWQYLLKAIVATAIAVVGALVVVLVGDMTFDDLTTGQVLTLIGVGLAELSAILGLQAAPAKIATSVRD